MKILFYSILFLATLGCSTFPYSGQGKYRRALDKKSAGDVQFSGLYQKFEFRGTILDQETLTLINNRRATFYSWDDSSKQENLQKELEASSGKTRMFLSFFTPDSTNDNLAKKKSIWKVYLHHAGQRTEGKVIKSRINLSEGKALYPYHNRWSTPYYVEFPVDSTSLNTNDLAFEISGPLGHRKVAF